MAISAPEVYRDYVTMEGGRKILYVRLRRALYGLLKSALLFYRKLWGDLSREGFELNPYDPCVANKVVNGEQMTVCWHVDDLFMTHQEESVIRGLTKCLERTYGKLEVKVSDELEYLGMDFKFGDGAVKISQEDFTLEVIKEFPEVIDTTAEDPASPRLFDVREPSDKNPPLGKEQAQVFHRTTAKLLYLAARARRDIRTAVAFLTTRVRAPCSDDWSKLRRVLRYLYRNPALPLTLRASRLDVVDWWVDASFAVHPDMKGHSGGSGTLGEGSMVDFCRKQRFNARSSTETELVGVDECMGKMEWTMRFLEAQRYSTTTTLHQDNISAMKLAANGKRLSTQRTRHLNIKFFYVTDQIEKGWLKVKHCGTKDMVADIFTKPLSGEQFRKLRAKIMNCAEDLEPEIMPLTPGGDDAQECVERHEGKSGKKKKKTISWADVAGRKPASRARDAGT
jgi:hypothetical protein